MGRNSGQSDCICCTLSLYPAHLQTRGCNPKSPSSTDLRRGGRGQCGDRAWDSGFATSELLFEARAAGLQTAAAPRPWEAHPVPGSGVLSWAPTGVPDRGSISDSSVIWCPSRWTPCPSTRPASTTPVPATLVVTASASAQPWPPTPRSAPRRAPACSGEPLTCAVSARLGRGQPPSPGSLQDPRSKPPPHPPVNSPSCLGWPDLGQTLLVSTTPR